MKKKFKIYRLINGKKVWIFQTNSIKKFGEKFDAMVDKYGKESLINQTMSSATFQYAGGF